jgi:hypothetical protein
MTSGTTSAATGKWQVEFRLQTVAALCHPVKKLIITDYFARIRTSKAY